MSQVEDHPARCNGEQPTAPLRAHFTRLVCYPIAHRPHRRSECRLTDAGTSSAGSSTTFAAMEGHDAWQLVLFGAGQGPHDVSRFCDRQVVLQVVVGGDPDDDMTLGFAS